MIRAIFALILLVLPTVAGGQILDDPAGDVRFGPTTDPSGHYDHADLRSLVVEERGEDIVFQLTVASGADTTMTIADEMDYTVGFRFGTYAYEVRITWSTITAPFSSSFYSTLYRQTSPDESMRSMGGLQTHGNPEAGVVEVMVPRERLRDKDGIEPFVGSQLNELRVTSRAYWPNVVDEIAAADRMPDLGSAVYEVTQGVVQTGEIRLSTDERIRGSNGQATTYFWRISIQNLNLTFDDSVTLSLLDVPDNWIARLPLAEADIPANETVEIPLLLTVPFAHLHGATDTLVLEARSVRDAESIGRLQLGIEYLDPAQPAAHHDRLYLHSGNAMRDVFRFGGVRVLGSSGPALFMNSLQEDAADGSEAVPGHMDTASEARTSRTGWVVPLSPALRLGIDMDMQGTGQLEVPIEAPLGLTDALLEGHFLVIPADGYSTRPADYDGFPGARVVAELEIGNPRTINGQTTFQQAIVPRLEGDRVPHDPNQQLVLVLWLHGDGAIAPNDYQAPAVLPGGTMTLPINEYHDAIDESFSAPDFLQVALKGQTERTLAPGTALLWELHVRNGGARSLDLEATVQGAGSQWMEFPAGTVHQIANNTTGIIPVAIRAPKDAEPGSSADVVIEVADLQDPRIRGIVRIVATVSNGGGPGDQIPEFDQTDEVDAIERDYKAKQSPGIGPLAIAALAFAAARRRL